MLFLGNFLFGVNRFFISIFHDGFVTKFPQKLFNRKTDYVTFSTNFHHFLHFFTKKSNLKKCPILHINNPNAISRSEFALSNAFSHWSKVFLPPVYDLKLKIWIKLFPIIGKPSKNELNHPFSCQNKSNPSHSIIF